MPNALSHTHIETTFMHENQSTFAMMNNQIILGGFIQFNKILNYNICLAQHGTLLSLTQAQTS